jgi:hypothetical protein
MSCKYTLRKNIKELLNISNSNKTEFSFEELVNLLKQNPDVLKKQTVMIFDLSNIKTQALEKIKPGFLNAFEFLEIGDQGSPIKSIFNPNKNLIAIHNIDNRILHTINERAKEKGAPLTETEKDQIKQDVADDELKGKFIKEVFNPFYLHDIISAKTEKEVK